MVILHLEGFAGLHRRTGYDITQALKAYSIQSEINLFGSISDLLCAEHAGGGDGGEQLVVVGQILLREIAGIINGTGIHLPAVNMGIQKIMMNC